ncbi:hypothetical protein IJI91_03500 [Candidatus Saccharibacteria bacterium]|nr:hypothetical protein [Candidatus Saccharibacteria bacterium]
MSKNSSRVSLRKLLFLVRPTSSTSSSSTTTNALRNDNIASPASNPTSENDNIYSYGVYYPWYTATAGRNPSSGATTGSICPYNWSLPISNTTSTAGSFGYLASTMDTTSATTKTASFRHYPNNFLYSGYASGSIYDRSKFTRYWSRTANTSNRAYQLYFYASSFSPSNYGSKSYGFSLRCIAGS